MHRVRDARAMLLCAHSPLWLPSPAGPGLKAVGRGLDQADGQREGGHQHLDRSGVWGGHGTEADGAAWGMWRQRQ